MISKAFNTSKTLYELAQEFFSGDWYDNHRGTYNI